MPSRVEHDPDVLLRLDVGQGRASGDSPAHCLVQISDSDVQMLGCVLPPSAAGHAGRVNFASYSKFSVGPSSSVGGRI